MLVPETEVAVTAVNVGEPRTDTIGADAVPPVVMLVPGWTLVAVPPPSNVLRSVEPL